MRAPDKQCQRIVFYHVRRLLVSLSIPLLNLNSNRNSSVYNKQVRNADELRRLIRDTTDKHKDTRETKKNTTISPDELLADIDN